jgi:DoxX-like family
MSPRVARRVGLALSVITSALLLADAITHIARITPVRTAMTDLGFDQNAAVVIGLIEVACLVLYLTPRTAVLGVVLFTGYFGGAICANFRVDKPLWSTILFPVYVAIALWAGLWLRDERLRSILPVRRGRPAPDRTATSPAAERQRAEAVA